MMLAWTKAHGSSGLYKVQTVAVAVGHSSTQKWKYIERGSQEGLGAGWITHMNINVCKSMVGPRGQSKTWGISPVNIRGEWGGKSSVNVRESKESGSLHKPQRKWLKEIKNNLLSHSHSPAVSENGKINSLPLWVLKGTYSLGKGRFWLRSIKVKNLVKRRL